MIVAPPFETGALHETTDWVSANDVAWTPIGAPGRVGTMTELEGCDEGLMPSALVAVTVNV